MLTISKIVVKLVFYKGEFVMIEIDKIIHNFNAQLDKIGVKLYNYSNEEGLTMYIAAFLSKKLPRFCDGGNNIWFHVPNGGERSRETGAKMKAMGVAKGVPDFCFIHNNFAYFIELKYGVGKLSEHQEKFFDVLRSQSEGLNKAEICTSLQQVLNCLHRWGIYNGQFTKNRFS